MQNEKNLGWIQLLRGVAALLVVLTHARYALLDTPDFPLAEQMLLPGAMGVDLFFIISGFIMCYSTAHADGSPADAARFLAKRFARVWPAYAVVTLLTALLLSGGIDYFHAAANRLTFWHTLGMIPANPHYVPYFSLTLPVGWTLEFEMYFYLVYAFSMLFRRLRFFVLAAWVVLTVFLLPMGRRGFDMDITRDLAYSSGYMNIVTSPFVLEFVSGVLIAWLYQRKGLRIPGRQVAWHVLGLGVAFAAWAIYSRAVFTHGPTQYGWPLALMVLAMALASKTVAIRAPAALVWLGSISYSLYLTHLMSQGLVRRALEGAGLAPLAHAWMFILLSTAVALSIASLSQYYLERKLSDIVRAGLLKLIPAKASRKTPAPAEPAPPRTAVEDIL